MRDSDNQKLNEKAARLSCFFYRRFVHIFRWDFGRVIQIFFNFFPSIVMN